MVAPAVASSASADAEAARLEMARALVAALETQERERGLVLVPTASDLARAAHEKLQYDFPRRLPRRARRPRGGDARGPARVPDHGAARRRRRRGRVRASRSDAAPTATSVAAAARARDDRDDDDANAGEARDARRRAFQRLCATVLVHVPLRAIRSSDADADAAFARYHPRLEASHARTSDDDAAADSRTRESPEGRRRRRNPRRRFRFRLGAALGAGRVAGRVAPGADPIGRRPPRVGVARPRRARRRQARRALRRAKSACFPDDAPRRRRRVGRLVRRPPRGARGVRPTEPTRHARGPRRAPARSVGARGPPPGTLGREREREHPPSSFFRRARLRLGARAAARILVEVRGPERVRRGGGPGPRPRRARAHLRAARRRGARRCAGGRVDFDGGGAREEDPRDAATRDVWRVVDAALAPVAARLERLVAEHRSRRDSNDRGEKQTIITATDDDALALDKWWLAVERCSIAAAFYAALAPGNADVGAALSAGGALRALASLFASPGVASSPRAEALRRAVALVAASAPDAAAFLGAVPGVRAAVFAPDASPRFRAGGALASHAAIMALTMRPTATTATKKKGSVDEEEEEDAEAACAKLLAPMLVGEEESVGDGEGCVVEGSEVSGAGAPGAGLPPRPRLARGSAASGLAAASAAGLLRGAQIAASRARAAPLWRAGGPVDATLRAAAAAHAETVAAGARARGRTAAARADAAERKATASDEEEEEEEAMYIRGDAARSGSVISGSSAVVGADVAAVVAAAKEADADGGGAEAAAREAAGLGGTCAGRARGGEGRRGAEKAREAAAAALRAIKEIVGAAEGGGGRGSAIEENGERGGMDE